MQYTLSKHGFTLDVDMPLPSEVKQNGTYNLVLVANDGHSFSLGLFSGRFGEKFAIELIVAQCILMDKAIQPSNKTIANDLLRAIHLKECAPPEMEFNMLPENDPAEEIEADTDDRPITGYHDFMRRSE